jgi:hypothetical protein
MPKDLREKVTLSPEAYKALQIEAMLRGGSMKETASKLILKAACPKCKEILDIVDREPKGDKAQVDTPAETPKGKEAKEPKGPITQKAQVRNVTTTQEPKSPKAKRKKLSEDTMALDQIKILWARDPRPSYSEIGRELGYAKSTVADQIKHMKGRGEL